MDKIILWVLENKLKCFCIAVVVLFFPIVLVTVLYKSCIFNFGIIENWTAGDLILYFMTFYSVLGTVSLGCVAVWQNIKAQERNVELATMQINVSNFQNTQEEFTRIQDAAKQYISSFDRGIFLFILNNYTAVSVDKLIEKIYKVKTNSFNNSIHIEFFPCYTKSSSRCADCPSATCEVRHKSQKYIEYLDLFKAEHIKYLTKYDEVSDKILSILVKIDNKNKKEIHMEKLAVLSKNNIDTLAIVTALMQQGDPQNNPFQVVYNSRMNEMLYIENEQKGIQEYIISAQSIGDEIGALRDDILYLTEEGYASLKMSLHRLVDQYKKELGLIPMEN